MTASIMREHARLGPSGWSRWSRCPGSVQLQAHFPNETSIYAAEGTAMHWVREQCLLTGNDVADYIGTEIQADGLTFTAAPEWVRWIQPGVDRLREAKGELFVEQRVSLEAWVPDEFGTVDALVVGADLIIVDDFKGGRGVVVEAERNGQLMQYALGAWENIARHRTDATEFLLRIDQPRAPGGGSEWRCTLDDLLRFAEDEYVPAVQATRDPDAALDPSPDACRFCRAANNAACPALHDYMYDLLGLEPDSEVMIMPDPDQLTPERRSFLIQQKPLVEKWLRSIHSLQLNEALAGRETPGFKAVATEGNRTWRDETEAEAFFENRVPKKDLYQQKLKSPAQLENIVGTRIWAKAQELIVRPEGPPALVPESDRRPALIPVIDLLDDLDDDDDLLGASAEIEENGLDELI